MVSFLLLIEAKNFYAFRKIEKSEFRAGIKHWYLKGLTPKEIKAELDEVHGTSAPVFATVYNWVNKFNLLAAGKFQYKSTSYKMQNLYIKWNELILQY